MKLNKKGIQKVLDNVFLTCDEETGYIVKHWMPDEDEEDFELDDFEGVVVLSIEEAKEIAVTMFAYHKFCQKFLSGVNDNFLIKASKVNHILDKRIEQAEVQDEIK